MKKTIIEIIQNKNALNSIASQWNERAKPFKSPLLSYEWFLSCTEAFYREEDIRVVVVRSGDNISAIAPLVIVKRNGIKWLELIGVSFLYEPCGLLYDSEDSLRALLKAILELRYPILLQRVPFNSPVARELSALTKFKGIFVNRATSSSAYISINSDWEAYYTSISSQRRYDYRRKQKRVKKKGEISMEIFYPDPKKLDQHLERSFRIEAAGWKGRKGSALLTNKKLQKFFRIYTELACRDGVLRIFFFNIGRESAGMLIGLEYANRFWVLKLGYDEKWARCSPGIQLTMETIRYAFENRLEAYEFLGSEEPWQNIWPHYCHTYSSLIVYPYSLYGLIGLGWDAQRFIMKKAFPPR